MLRDPCNSWEGGEHPYDVMRPVGITPDSTRQQVLDAQYDMVDKKLWTPEKRPPWDELRNIESRIWLDLFYYPVSEHDIGEAVRDLVAAGEEVAVPDVKAWLELDFRELDRLADDLRAPESYTPLIPRIADLSPGKEEILGRIKL